MRTTRGPDGRDRLWFDGDEIERIMEAELRKASLLPDAAKPEVDIERFIEKHLRAHLDQYAVLEPSVLGLTEFVAGKPPKVSINKTLTGSALDEDESAPGMLGRYRATLAHEAAHILLHRCLFEFAIGNMSLFEQPTKTATLQRCLKRDASFRRVTDWREFQANEGMAALLMPRTIFTSVARTHIERVFPGRIDIPDGQGLRVVPFLANAFSVSRQAATIRLTTLKLLAKGQERLL